MIQSAELVQFAGITGQDRVLIKRFDSKTILAVADGAGGLSGGAEAADMAIAVVARQIDRLQSRADCERLLRELDGAISNDGIAGETTCVVTVVTSEQIAGASVGDSGAWLISSGGVDDLSRNQSRKPLLGSGVAVVAGFERSSFEGTLLVATDGLLKYASQEAIAEAARDPSLGEAVKRLIGLVRYSSGALPDDVAVVVCRHSS